MRQRVTHGLHTILNRKRIEMEHRILKSKYLLMTNFKADIFLFLHDLSHILSSYNFFSTFICGAILFSSFKSRLYQF